MQNCVSNMIQKISEETKSPCRLVILEGNCAHLKTDKNEHQPSIGYMYTFMESIKRGNEYPITEY